jgi:hypothetical protein
MAKYLHLFDTEAAFNAAYNGNDYLEPWVSYTDETQGQEHVDYNKEPVWLDLTGHEYPATAWGSVNITSEPTIMWPEVGTTVTVREPDGTVHDYMVTQNDPESQFSCERDLTEEEWEEHSQGGTINYGDVFFIAKSFENESFYWENGFNE